MNNKNRFMKYYASQRQRFSIRKLTIGVSSVMLGSLLLWSSAQTSSAAKNNKSNITAPTNEELANNNHDESQEKVVMNNLTIDQSHHISKLASKQIENNLTQNASSIQTKVKTQTADQNNSGKPDPNSSDISQTTQDNVMAGRDNVFADITLNNLKSTDKTIQLHFHNVGANNDFIISSTDLKNAGESYTVEDGSWKITNSGSNNGITTLTADWLKQDIDPTRLHLTIALQGNKTTITTDKKNNASAYLTVNNDQQSHKLITANLIPYKDEVKKGEIISGFSMGEKTVKDEARYIDNLINEVENLGGNDNSKLLQWGFYFNYDKGGEPNLSPLQNAIFNIAFNNGQKIIKSSIKVFEVPYGYAYDISKNPHIRHGINDPIPATNNVETYYQAITKNENKDRTFEQYLKSIVENNQISVDQSNATTPTNFHVKNDNGNPKYKDDHGQEYAKHAYFFQLDTLVPTTPQPGEFVANVSYTDGIGQTPIKQTVDANVSGNGSGSGHNKVNKVTETKTIIENIKYIDEATGQEIYAPYSSNTLTFTRTQIIDLVTNKIIKSTPWTLSSLDFVPNPTIKNYTIDPAKIKVFFNHHISNIASGNANQINAVSFTQDEITNWKNKDNTIDIVVPYTKNLQPKHNPSNPTSPDQPTVPQNPTPTPHPLQPQPQQPTQPNKPTQPITPTSSKHVIKKSHPKIDHYSETSYQVKSSHTTETSLEQKKGKTSTPVTTTSHRSELPKTGEKTNQFILIGLAIATLGGIFSLSFSKKRHN